MRRKGSSPSPPTMKNGFARRERRNNNRPRPPIVDEKKGKRELFRNPPSMKQGPKRRERRGDGEGLFKNAWDLDRRERRRGRRLKIEGDESSRGK